MISCLLSRRQRKHDIVTPSEARNWIQNEDTDKPDLEMVTFSKKKGKDTTRRQVSGSKLRATKKGKQEKAESGKRK